MRSDFSLKNGTAEPVSRDQILRHVRGHGNTHFPCSADHEQEWQPYPRLINTLLYVMTIHTYIIHKLRRANPLYNHEYIF